MLLVDSEWGYPNVLLVVSGADFYHDDCRYSVDLCKKPDVNK